MGSSDTPIVAKVLYWFLGAPAVFLGMLHVGVLPLVILGPAEERASITNLVVAPYLALLVVGACYFTWACWRAVRGEHPSIAFRPFPWPIWVGAALLGIVSGAVTFVHAT